MTSGQLVWFITGTSAGLGNALVSSALNRGDLVIATARRIEDFSLLNADWSRLHVLQLDVTDTEEHIQQIANRAVTVWGRVDVLVNNAGSVPRCIAEEGGTESAEAQFQTNFFGVVKVTNALLPHMRDRRSGTIVNVGSRSAWSAYPGFAFYSASKAAVHAYNDILAAEVAQFNVRVLLIAPGSIRTDNFRKLQPVQDRHIPAYDKLREAAVKMSDEHWKAVKGDPSKVMELLVDVVRGEGQAKGRELPPLLVIGRSTYDQVKVYSGKLQKAMQDWEDVAQNLDFDAPST